ncbi:MAG: PspC domain-containing protein [bacterium]
MASSEEPASSRRIYRSKSNRWIAGVCGGVAEHFGWDATIVRIIWAVSLCFGGFGGLAYIVSWIVIPEGGDEAGTHAEKTTRTDSNLLWGLFFVVVGALVLFRQLDWFDFYPFYITRDWDSYPFWSFNFRFDWLLPTALILLGAVYILAVRKREKEGTESTGSGTTGDIAMEKRFMRSVDDRMCAGVCGGLAKYFNIDPSFVRIGFVLLTLAGGVFIGVVAYIVMMVIVPEDSGDETAETATKTAAPPAPARPAKPAKPPTKPKGGTQTPKSRK